MNGCFGLIPALPVSNRIIVHPLAGYFDLDRKLKGKPGQWLWIGA